MLAVSSITFYNILFLEEFLSNAHFFFFFYLSSFRDVNSYEKSMSTDDIIWRNNDNNDNNSIDETWKYLHDLVFPDDPGLNAFHRRFANILQKREREREANGKSYGTNDLSRATQ